jgi:hypothetical protein
MRVSRPMTSSDEDYTTAPMVSFDPFSGKPILAYTKGNPISQSGIDQKQFQYTFFSLSSLRRVNLLISLGLLYKIIPL